MNFMNTLRKFCAIRGTPSLIMTDNAKTFKTIAGLVDKLHANKGVKNWKNALNWIKHWKNVLNESLMWNVHHRGAAILSGWLAVCNVVLGNFWVMLNCIQ